MSSSSDDASQREQDQRDREQEEREAEEERRRARVRKEISEKQSVVRRCESSCSRLKRELDAQAREISRWNGAYRIFENHPVTSQVVLSSVFEGICADKLGSELPRNTDVMRHSKMEGTGLMEDLEEQISRIQSYIDQLEEDISDLYDSL